MFVSSAAASVNGSTGIVITIASYSVCCSQTPVNGDANKDVRLTNKHTAPLVCLL